MIRRLNLRSFAWLPALACLGVLAGCGGSPMIDCTGQVLLGGKPVADATVMFIPKDGSRSATGKTDAEGRFRLTTFEPDDGTLPGEYTVTVAAFVAVPPKPKPGARVDDAFDRVHLRWIVPKKYAAPATSGLTATVSSAQSDFTFDLKP